MVAVPQPYQPICVRPSTRSGSLAPMRPKLKRLRSAVFSPVRYPIRPRMAT